MGLAASWSLYYNRAVYLSRETFGPLDCIRGMTIKARYLDTCLPCYLQDHHNRDGETLVYALLGCTVEDTVDQMIENLDMDLPLPANWSVAALKESISKAIAGVDLRTFDETGNRIDGEATESEIDQAPMIYVLLTWDATKVKMKLEVDVEYQSNGVDPYQLKLMREDVIRQAAANGSLVGGTDAVVTSWGGTATYD